MRKNTTFLALAMLACCAATAHAQQAAQAMSAAWAGQLCAAWNADATLTGKLVESGWVKNDAGRGFKAMQIWRNDCQDSPRIEVRIALQDGRAQCVYGGAATTTALDRGSDYQMWADTPRWREMGDGAYGPMKAMMFGRLQFDGPRLEAMGNMGPFENFLRLVGQVPGEWGACPK